MNETLPSIDVINRSASPVRLPTQRTRSFRNVRQIESPEPQIHYVDVNVETKSDNMTPDSEKKLETWKNENCMIEVDVDKPIGRGSYGDVYPLKHDPLRVMKVSRVKDSNAASTLVEACMLKSMKHPYLLSAEKVILPYLCEDGVVSKPLSSIEMIMPKADADIFNLIPSSSMELMKVIVPKSALGVKALHEAGFIHRDLKPENILLFNNDKTVKIADFGLSCLRINGLSYSTNVQTLHYRAPELLRQDACYYYTDKIDVFSLGITWLVILGRAIFYGGEDRQGRLQVLNQKYNQDGKFNINVLVRFLCHNKVLAERMNNGADMEITLFIDLIRNMTHRDPNQRFDMQQVMESAYIQQYGTKDVIHQPVQFTALPPYQTDFQNINLWKKALKRIFELASTIRQDGSIEGRIIVRNIISCYAFELLLRSRQSPFKLMLTDDLTIAASVYLAEMVVFPVSYHVNAATINDSVVKLQKTDREQLWFILQTRIVAMLQAVDFTIFSDTLWQKALQKNMAKSQQVPLMNSLMSWAQKRKGQ